MPRHKGNPRGSLDETAPTGIMLPRLPPQTEPPLESPPPLAGSSSYRLSRRRSLTILPRDTLGTSPTAQSPVNMMTSPTQIHQAGQNLPGNTSPCSAGHEAELLPRTRGSSEDNNDSPGVANGPTFITQSRRRLRPLTYDGAATAASNATKSMSHIDQVSSLLPSRTFETAQSREDLPRKAKSCIGEDMRGNQKKTETCDDNAPADGSTRRIRQRRRSVTFVIADTSSENGAKEPEQRSRSSMEISFFDDDDDMMQAMSAYDIDSAGVEDPRQVGLQGMWCDSPNTPPPPPPLSETSSL